MALGQKRRWTFEEYQERPDELAFAELLGGELIMAPSPLRRHQRLTGYLYRRLGNFLDDHPLGEVYIAPFDVRLNPQEAKAFHPDVLFVRSERIGIITSKGIQGAPDLVVEILSQGTAKYDLSDKKAAYEAAGVPEYWALWQDWPRVEVYRLVARPGEASKAGRYGDPHLLEAGDSLITDLLPGFALALDDLYRDLPPAEAE